MQEKLFAEPKTLCENPGERPKPKKMLWSKTADQAETREHGQHIPVLDYLRDKAKWNQAENGKIIMLPLEASGLMGSVAGIAEMFQHNSETNK